MRPSAELSRGGVSSGDSVPPPSRGHPPSTSLAATWRFCASSGRRAPAAASLNWPADYLAQCSLVTTFEPCAMCAGTVYWANIGRVVYGMTEAQLLAETGSHAENPTMSVPSRYVFDHCQKPVELIGPVPEIAEETVAMQRAFWASR